MMFLGLDFGTSGARACVIDNAKAIAWKHHVTYPDPCPTIPDRLA